MTSSQPNILVQVETYREWVLGALEGVTEAEANLIPTGFRNNIRWNVGHLYLDQYLWIETITREKIQVLPDEFHQWFGFGTSPSNFQPDTPTLTELIPYLRNQPIDIREQFSNRLDETFPPTEMGMRTIEQVLSRTIFHEGMHLQAILDLKKCISSQSV